MKVNPPAVIFSSTVMHSRRFPMRYRFSYRVFSLLVDIDQLEAIDRNPVLSVDRFNLFSLRTQDHGARDGSPWRPWAEQLLRENGIDAIGGKIRLLCFPRVLGYGFNPLSLWFCHAPGGELMAVICEVRNTFGEHHHYLLHNHNRPFANQVTGVKDKIFHVSPFINMQARYEFFIQPPDEQLDIVIHEYQDDELMLVATQKAREQLPFKTSTLLRCFARMPFLTLKIMALIHWQALKIWLKGGKFHRKPTPPLEKVS